MARSIVRHLGAVGTTIALALGAVTTTVSPASAAEPTVVVVGDSIVNGSKAQIEARFSAEGWNVYANGESGESVARRRQDIRDFVAFFDPDVMVISLGTNDMGEVGLNPPGQAPPSTNEQLVRYANAVNQMVAAINDMPNVPCIVWVNVNDWTNWDPFPSHNSGSYNLRGWSPYYNAELREEDGNRARFHVIDYVAKIRAKRLNPGDTNFLPWLAEHYDPGVLIHPTTSLAKQTLAKIMADGTETACGI